MFKGKRHFKWKTSVKKNTLLPVFNEAFQFDIAGMDLRDITLEVLVMDYDRFSRNDLMGVISIGENVAHLSGRNHWLAMQSSPNQAISNWHSLQPPTPLLIPKEAMK